MKRNSTASANDESISPIAVLSALTKYLLESSLINIGCVTPFSCWIARAPSTVSSYKIRKIHNYTSAGKGNNINTSHYSGRHRKVKFLVLENFGVDEELAIQKPCRPLKMHKEPLLG